MGTHNNTKKAGNKTKHQGSFSCRVSPVIDEQIVEDEVCDTALELRCFTAAAVLTTAGVMALSEAYRTGLPLRS